MAFKITDLDRSKPAGTCARYIGRVGALAVAFGVSGAIVAPPAVAWAEGEESATQSSAKQSSSTESAKQSSSTESATTDASEPTADDDPSPSESSVEPGEQASVGDQSGEAPQDEAGDDVGTSEDETTAVDEVTSQREITPADKVTVQSSGGAFTSGDDAEGDATERREPRPPVGVNRTAADTSIPESDPHPVGTGTVETAGPAAAPASAPQPSVPSTEVDHFPDSVPMPHATALSDSTTATTALSTGTPTMVQTVVRMLNAALAPLLGPGPSNPVDPPLAWALLGWVRRQFGQDAPEPVAVVPETEDVAALPIAPQMTALAPTEVTASSLPADLERTVIVSGLEQPVDFRILPGDMGILIAEKNGSLKLFHDDHLATVTTLPVTTDGERGIGGIEIDPDFAINRYVYVSYTRLNPAGVNVNRLARFTLSEDFQSVGSERVILEYGEPNQIHHGGMIRFHPTDGMLYFSTGDNNNAPSSQDLGNLHGKVLRIDPQTLQAAEGNPYIGVAGARPEVWASGFRNPFRFTFSPDGDLVLGDVGSANWEELNLVLRGGNYGWPLEEGPCDGCSFVNPIYAYPHTPLPARAGAITSVLYYTDDGLGEQYQNRVFISDYTLGWIKVLTFDEQFTSLIDVQTFDDEAGAVLQLIQGPDGNIYALDYFGELSVIAPSGGNRAPEAIITAQPGSGYADLKVEFSGAESSDPEGLELAYSWDFGVEGDDDVSTVAAPTWTYTQNGTYVVTLTVTDAAGEADTAAHQIVVGSLPPTIEALTLNGVAYDPSSPHMYSAGDTITFGAQGSDIDLPQDQKLTASAYEWTVIFHHANHIHPFASDIVGPSGSITIPRDPHNAANTWYEIQVSLTDSSGLSTTDSMEVRPNVVELVFTSNNPDAVYTIDGVPYHGTHTEMAVVGVERVIGAVTPQAVNGRRLVFGSWSDGSLPTHTIVTPGAATTYAITYDEYVAPRSPDLGSVADAFLRAQRGNVQQMATALDASIRILSQAQVSSSGAVINTLARAATPVVNVVTDVLAAEAIRTIGAAAAFGANIIPLATTVLAAPLAIADILVDTALTLVESVIRPDPLRFFDAINLAQVLLDDEVSQQRGLFLGAVANLLDDVGAAYAVPLPPAAEVEAPTPNDPLLPIARSVQRTLTIGERVGASALDIARTAVAGQVQAAGRAVQGVQAFLADSPDGELVLDWLEFILTQAGREANAGRQALGEAIGRAGENLGGAGSRFA